MRHEASLCARILSPHAPAAATCLCRPLLTHTPYSQAASTCTTATQEVDRPPADTPFPHVNDGMATIRKLAWEHFWRLYARRVAALAAALVMLTVAALVVLAAPCRGITSRGASEAVAEQQRRRGLEVRTRLRFPSRSCLVADPDGGKRIVLNSTRDEISPPNAEEHEVAVRVAGGATRAGSAATACGAARAGADAGLGGAAGEQLPRPRLFSDGFEFVGLSHQRILSTLEQLHAAGRLGSKHLSGAPGGRSSSSGSRPDTAASASSASATTTAGAPMADARDLPTLEDALASQLQGWSPFGRAPGWGEAGWTAGLGGGWASPSYAAKCAGFVMRRGGTLGAAMSGSGNGFDRVARRVHIDQDLAGEPLRSRGLTWLFRLPGVELLNLWIPLDEVVRLQPLALMSTATLNPHDVARLRANSTQNAGGHGGSFSSDRLAVVRRRGEGQQQFFFKP